MRLRRARDPKSDREWRRVIFTHLRALVLEARRKEELHDYKAAAKIYDRAADSALDAGWLAVGKGPRARGGFPAKAKAYRRLAERMRWHASSDRAYWNYIPKLRFWTNEGIDHYIRTVVGTFTITTKYGNSELYFNPLIVQGQQRSISIDWRGKELHPLTWAAAKEPQHPRTVNGAIVAARRYFNRLTRERPPREKIVMARRYR